MHTYRCVASYAVHLHLHTYGDGPMCYQTNAFKSLQLKVGCAYMYVHTYIFTCMYVSDCESVCLYFEFIFWTTCLYVKYVDICIMFVHTDKSLST